MSIIFQTIFNVLRKKDQKKEGTSDVADQDLIYSSQQPPQSAGEEEPTEDATEPEGEKNEDSPSE